MTNVMSPRRTRTATATMLVSFAMLGGCGDEGNDRTGGSVAVAGTTMAADATTVENQFVEVVGRVSPQVVQIETRVGLGSGIVYDDSGHLVTNAHVAGTSHRFRVTLANGERHEATLVGSDPAHDVAVIQLVDARPAPATLADSTGVRSGDIVFAIGNPLGLQSSVTQGIVSSLNRKVPEGNGVTLSDVIQTSAEINPGNSGGALVDLAGHVVGVPTLAALDPEFGGAPAPGIGFAIPSNTVKDVADRLIAAQE